jgi:hypothetical protein
MNFVFLHDRRGGNRIRYQDDAARPLLRLASGEYHVADLSPGSVKILPRSVPGFLPGQRLAANLCFPDGDAIPTEGIVYRVGEDGIVIRFTRSLPTMMLASG